MMRATTTLGRLLGEALVPRWRLYVLTLICVIGVALFTALLAWSTKLIVNDVFAAGADHNAPRVALMVIGISVGMAGFTYANNVLGVLFQRQIAAQLQRDIFGAMLHRPVHAFTGDHAAAQMAQVMLFGRAGGTLVVDVSNRMLTEALTLIGLVAVMVWQDPVMSLAAFVLFPLIGLIVSRLTRKIRAIAAAEVTLTGKLMSVGEEAFAGIKTVRSYGLEDKSRGRFTAAVMALETRMLRIARAAALTVPLMQGLGGVMIGLFVLYASWQTNSLGKSPGEFTAFITAFLLAYQPAERLSKSIVELQKSLVQVEAMYALRDDSSTAPHEGRAALPEKPGALRFENVAFAYADMPALADISFTIEPGEKVAIVGASGAGKTTLIDLVQRFYSPRSGQIRIGDVPLETLSEASLRDAIALIQQDVFLFEGSIADNIKDGAPDADRARIEQVAAQAAVRSFADKLPQGLDSEIGPNGSALSGGQRQRIGIARALIKRAHIYIFDEATSALDGENDAAIMQAATRNAPDSIALFITHRASTLKWMDKVLLLDQGRLMAFDTHEELLRTSPLYRALFDLPQQKDG